MLANAQAHAREYLPLFSVGMAIFARWLKVHTQYEAACEVSEALQQEIQEQGGWKYDGQGEEDELHLADKALEQK